jgi:hypothetical protein
MARERAPKRPRLDPTPSRATATASSSSSSPLSNPETVQSSSEDLEEPAPATTAAAAAAATAAAADAAEFTGDSDEDDDDDDEEEDRPLRTLVNGAASAGQKRRKGGAGPASGGKGIGRTGPGMKGTSKGKLGGKGTGMAGMGGMSRTVPAEMAAALEDQGTDTGVDVDKSDVSTPVRPVIPLVPFSEDEKRHEAAERATALKKDRLPLESTLSMDRITGGVSIDVDEVATLVRCFPFLTDRLLG